MSKKVLGIGLAVAGMGLMMIPGVGTALGLGMIAKGISVASVIGIGLMVGSNFLLGPAKPKGLQTSPTDRLHASLDPTAPRKIVFGGPTAMATDVRYQAFTGAGQEYLEQIVCVASHEVQSIDELWLDNEKAWTLAGGAQGRYVGYLTVTPRTVGTSTNGIAIDANWTTSSTLTGCAYLHARFKLTGNSKSAESPFSGGVTSRMTVRGKGAKVYDPRLDGSVAGGAGTQRAADQSTWAWNDSASRNPALQELWYELGWKIAGKLAVGKGVPPARLDLASFAVAANACDETVTKSAANGGGSEPRYRSDGVLSEADGPGAVRDNLCASMNAVLRDAGGKLALTVLYNDLATPVTPSGKTSFDEDDIIGEMQWDQTPDLSAMFNVIRGRGPDPSDTALYQLVDIPEIRIASPDGIDRIESVDYPFVQSNGQRQRLNKQRLQRNQYQGRMSFVGKPSFWGLNLGDVFPLTHPAYGWTNKLFRCAGQKISRSGETEIVAVEENAAIYQWDNDESAAVAPGTPTVYDPTNDPLVQGIGDAGTTAEWPNINDPVGTKPENNATKSRVFRQTTAPASPTLNDTWVDTSLTPTVTKVWDGAAWQLAATVGATWGVNAIGFGGLAGKEAVDLAGTDVLNKTADNIAESLARKWAGETGATVGARRGTNLYDGGGFLYSQEDIENSQLTLVHQRTGETERVLLKRGATTNTELNLGNLYNAGQPNLLFNGGFRLTDSAGKPLGWTLDAGWNWIAGNSEGPFMHAAVGGTIVGTSEPMPVAAGEAYSLQGELFAGGVTAGSLNADVQWYSDAAATVLVLDDGEISAVNGANWAKRTRLDYVAPAGAIRARVRFFLAAATNTSAAVRRIKFSGGASESPFSDEKTVDAELLTRAGTGRRLADGRNQTSNRNFGIRSLYNAPTITGSDAGTTATIDITASSFVSDWGATISYPVGQFTGLAFSTKYYIWRNQPDPSTAGDSYGISTSLGDALGVGKTYMGYCTTPADGGTSTGGGTGGTVNCVGPDMWVEMEDGSFKRARDVLAGDRIVVLDYATLDGTRIEEVESNCIGTNERVRLTTQSSASLTLALNTPITLRNGRIDIAANAWRHLLPVKDESGFRWERCVNVEHVGSGEVSHIRCHGATYAAGETQGRSVLTHNPEVKP